MKFVGGKLHYVRAGRRSDGASDGARASRYSRGSPRGRAADQRQDRAADRAQESTAGSTVGSRCHHAAGRLPGTVARDAQTREAGTRGHTATGGQPGHQERAMLLPLLRHQLQLSEHLHSPQEVLLLEPRGRGEQQQQ